MGGEEGETVVALELVFVRVEEGGGLAGEEE